MTEQERALLKVIVDADFSFTVDAIFEDNNLTQEVKNCHLNSLSVDYQRTCFTIMKPVLNAEDISVLTKIVNSVDESIINFKDKYLYWKYYDSLRVSLTEFNRRDN